MSANIKIFINETTISLKSPTLITVDFDAFIAQEMYAAGIFPQHITKIVLSKFFLNQSLIMKIENLFPNLRELYLSDCQILDDINEKLKELKNLRKLYLTNSQYKRFLPKFLGKLTFLNALNLSNNQLIGPIPDFLGNLRILRILDLTGNQLTGPIPESLGNLKILQILRLSKNKLSGPLPYSLGNLRRLSEFTIDKTNIKGFSEHAIKQSFAVLEKLAKNNRNFKISNIQSLFPYLNLQGLRIEKILEKVYKNLYIRRFKVPSITCESIVLDPVADEKAGVLSAALTTTRKTKRKKPKEWFTSALSASMASTSKSPRTSQPFQTFTGHHHDGSPVDSHNVYHDILSEDIFQQISNYTQLFCPTSSEGSAEIPFYYVVTSGISMHGGSNFRKGPLMQHPADQSIFIQLAPFGEVTYAACNSDREEMVQTFFGELHQQTSANDAEKLRFLKDPLQSIESISQEVRPILQQKLTSEHSYKDTDTFWNVISKPKYQRIPKQMTVHDKMYGIGDLEVIDGKIKDTGYIYVQINAYPERKDKLLCSILIKFAIIDREFLISRFAILNAIRNAIDKAHKTWGITPQFKITNIFADFACSRGSYDDDHETALGRKKTQKKRKTKKRKTKKQQ